MTRPRPIPRELGTMVAYGFAKRDVGFDLEVATRLGASCVEILPDWGRFPDPRELRRRVLDAGLRVHSAHGCWGGQSIEAVRVDLGSLDEAAWRASVEDLMRCLDWLAEAGGSHLVVHPGGLSDPEDAEARLSALERGLVVLGDHARASGLIVCVENMPPGVHPGSRMEDLKNLVDRLGHSHVGLALDTGHGHLNGSASGQTRAAGSRLRTTHVHDNDGRHDSHDPPGSGTIDWGDWAKALDEVEYDGPVMLECIRQLRQAPERIDGPFLDLLARLTS